MNLQQLRKTLESYPTPDALERDMLALLGIEDKSQIFEELSAAFEAYKSIYQTIEELDEFFAAPDMSFDVYVAWIYESYVQVYLALEKNSNFTVKKLPKEKTLYTFHDNNFVDSYKEKIDKELIKPVFDIFESQSVNSNNVKEISRELKRLGYDELKENFINGSYAKDYPRVTIVIPSLGTIPRNTVENIEKFVTDFLKTNDLPEEFSPVLIALLTTLTSQGSIPQIAVSALSPQTYNLKGNSLTYAGGKGPLVLLNVDVKEKNVLKISNYLHSEIFLRSHYEIGTINNIHKTEISIKVEKQLSPEGQYLPKFTSSPLKFSQATIFDPKQGKENLIFVDNKKTIFKTPGFDKDYFSPYRDLLCDAFDIYLDKGCTWNYSLQDALQILEFKIEQEKIKPSQSFKEDFKFITNEINAFYKKERVPEEVGFMLLSHITQRLKNLEESKKTLDNGDRIRYIKLLAFAFSNLRKEHVVELLENSTIHALYKVAGVIAYPELYQDYFKDFDLEDYIEVLAYHPNLVDDKILSKFSAYPYALLNLFAQATKARQFPEVLKKFTGLLSHIESLIRFLDQTKQAESQKKDVFLLKTDNPRIRITKAMQTFFEFGTPQDILLLKHSLPNFYQKYLTELPIEAKLQFFSLASSKKFDTIFLLGDTFLKELDTQFVKYAFHLQKTAPKEIEPLKGRIRMIFGDNNRYEEELEKVLPNMNIFRQDTKQFFETHQAVHNQHVEQSLQEAKEFLAHAKTEMSNLTESAPLSAKDRIFNFFSNINPKKGASSQTKITEVDEKEAMKSSTDKVQKTPGSTSGTSN